MAESYIPGVCNIGPAEIKKRRRSGWFGAAASVVLVTALVAAKTPAPWRLLVFFPATLAASGFFQGALHFCVGFGFKSVFNFAEPGSTENVVQAEFRKLDRDKARTILVYSLLAGLTAALIAYFIGI